MSAATARLSTFIAENGAAEPRPSAFLRAVRAIQRAQQRRAEREIARFIETRGGGRLTDGLERAIERHFV